MLSSVIIFMLTFFPYVPAGSEGILRNVFMYRSILEPYGLIPLQLAWHTPLMLLCVFTAPAFVRKRPLDEALLTCVLVWLVTTPGITAYYFLMPIMIAALDARRHGGWMMALGLIVAYIEVNMIIPDHASLPLMRLAWGGAWGVVSLWLLTIVAVRLPRTRRAVVQVRRNFFR